jgi:hypothetical protein
MNIQCKLFKITMDSLNPNDSHVNMVFWAYNFNEARARDAALHWASMETGGVPIISITKVDEIK